MVILLLTIHGVFTAGVVCGERCHDVRLATVRNLLETVHPACTLVGIFGILEDPSNVWRKVEYEDASDKCKRGRRIRHRALPSQENPDSRDTPARQEEGKLCRPACSPYMNGDAIAVSLLPAFGRPDRMERPDP
ncbi:MAG: hypothetical protein ACE5HU_03040 [Acidobacteriota bacterium]